MACICKLDLATDLSQQIALVMPPLPAESPHNRIISIENERWNSEVPATSQVS